MGFPTLALLAERPVGLVERCGGYQPHHDRLQPLIGDIGSWVMHVMLVLLPSIH
ncbi:hypothetical protein ACSS6W_010231 [Trichoderma asperelloides]